MKLEVYRANESNPLEITDVRDLRDGDVIRCPRRDFCLTHQLCEIRDGFYTITGREGNDSEIRVLILPPENSMISDAGRVDYRDPSHRNFLIRKWRPEDQPVYGELVMKLDTVLQQFDLKDIQLSPSQIADMLEVIALGEDGQE